MKFVLASQNVGKLAELQDILQGQTIEVCLQSQVGVNLSPEEDGTTFAENALIKAKAVSEASGLPAIADDSGLCVDSLGGGPGVYSARYGGDGLTDQGRYQLLLKNMQGQGNRACRFVSAICCYFPDGTTLTAEGTCEGKLAFAPVGEGGFGYDPIFFLPEYKRTMAELTSEEKNAISHRGKALEVLSKLLEDYLNGTK